MWVKFTNPYSLNYWIHCIPIRFHSLQPMNSFKIQWNHLAYKVTFCCNDYKGTTTKMDIENKWNNSKCMLKGGCVLQTSPLSLFIYYKNQKELRKIELKQGLLKYFTIMSWWTQTVLGTTNPIKVGHKWNASPIIPFF
jgi:hypothetical protein